MTKYLSLILSQSTAGCWTENTMVALNLEGANEMSTVSWKEALRHPLGVQPKDRQLNAPHIMVRLGVIQHQPGFEPIGCRQTQNRPMGLSAGFKRAKGKALSAHRLSQRRSLLNPPRCQTQMKGVSNPRILIHILHGCSFNGAACSK